MTCPLFFHNIKLNPQTPEPLDIDQFIWFHTQNTGTNQAPNQQIRSTNILHHLSLSVSDLKKSATFYDNVLSAIGYKRVCTSDDFVGYGTETNKDQFAISHKTNEISIPSPGFHLAFAANSRKSVDAFHQTALESGGKDNGKPGLRIDYGPDYYAAFVCDPDGYKIEAVINAKE